MCRSANGAKRRSASTEAQHNPNEEQNKTERYEKQLACKKIDWISIKSKRFAPNLCTDEIQLSTNLFPKNHCLGLTQTPGNSN